MEAFERKIFPRRPFIFCTTNTRNKVEWRNDALLDCASLYNSACVANQLRYISPFPTLIFFQILNPFCTSDELRRGNWCPCKTFRRLKDRSRFPLSLSLFFSLLENNSPSLSREQRNKLFRSTERIFLDFCKKMRKNCEFYKVFEGRVVFSIGKLDWLLVLEILL